MLICCVVAARPNFVKMAPVVRQLERRGWPVLLVHTGQHYDHEMSGVFLDQLGLRRPDVNLGVGSGTHAEQTAGVMVGFEKVIRQRRPDLVLVAGDVNSTAAAALVASKEGIPVGHVEAGLRSLDRSMPEEINRVITDHLSELLFTTEESANRNLLAEGIPAEKIHFVGNCMVDSLDRCLRLARQLEPWRILGLEKQRYALVTLHRPSNVDRPEALRSLTEAISKVGRIIPTVFAVHPRTEARLAALGVDLRSEVAVCRPLPYLTFLGLMSEARVVLTDSGGIQEETTALAVPCLTLRENTERPVTLELGTNRLVGCDPERIVSEVEQVLSAPKPQVARPPLWDGAAAARIAAAIEAWFGQVEPLKSGLIAG